MMDNLLRDMCLGDSVWYNIHQILLQQQQHNSILYFSVFIILAIIYYSTDNITFKHILGHMPDTSYLGGAKFCSVSYLESCKKVKGLKF